MMGFSKEPGGTKRMLGAALVVVALALAGAAAEGGLAGVSSSSALGATTTTTTTTTTPSTTATTSTSTTTPSTTTATSTASSTTSSTSSTTPATGCPPGSGPVAIADVTSPAHLEITGFQASPSVIPGNFSSFTVQVKVSDTCGQAVQGALVYATAVPFHQVTIPAEAATGPDGTTTLTFTRLGGFPASAHQGLLALFIRARKNGESLLSGIAARRLVSIRVRLHG